ncbi:MAG: hypothetical protein RI900_2889 [Actinomycetota bacterium]
MGNRPVIDVHTHILGTEWLKALRERGAPTYEVRPVAAGRECIFRDGAPVTVPTPGHFDLSLRLRDMDAAGVDLAVVSLTCPNVYWGGAEVSAHAARVSNDELAGWQREAPSRIRWFASLPWEYPELAVVELRRAHAAGAVGVMVLANVAGRSLTAPEFAPVWAEIDRLALPVLVHPTDPPGVASLDMGKYDLTWSVGFMFDTTLAIGRMIMDGFFDRYPRLKIIASHGGAALAMLVGRFEKGHAISTLEDQVAQHPPSHYLRHIFYDCITYDARTLAYLVSVVGESQVLFGSDYPHIVGDMAGMLSIADSLGGSAASAIRGDNAERIFAL